ncbi:MAG: SDR family NAD(P)-dependent oxidoreductase [Anaerolineae bacterium]|nr:SDR family NAD(P)-dependent oxidoreductase [Anaerolineae bacterium]
MSDTIQPNGEGVLITGCSSGIGRATAIHLAQRGFTVFAGVRKQVDAAALRNLGEPNLVPVCPLDLVDLENIPAVVDTVNEELARRGRVGLRALIQNAGGGSIAPIELMSLAGFSAEVEARLVGSVALVQACLPLLRKVDGGRVVWITTPAIIPTPYVASIHACDFAVNCIARTLDIELKPWNVASVMVRCGGIRTPSADRSMDELAKSLQEWPRERAALYEQALQEWRDSMAGFDARRTPPEKVAEVVCRALVARSPKRRYSVGYMAGAAAFLEALPQPLADAILRMRF